jgi:hypothetical protein
MRFERKTTGKQDKIYTFQEIKSMEGLYEYVGENPGRDRLYYSNGKGDVIMLCKNNMEIPIDIDWYKTTFKLSNQTLTITLEN